MDPQETSEGVFNAPSKQFEEMALDQLSEILSLTIKHDRQNKLVTFLAMLSAFTDHSQINVSFNAASSSGKTYIVTEVAKLFPAEDKIELGGASPTSFLYGEAEEDEGRKARIVSLERKILIFTEQPNPILQAKLRPVLSHDSKEIHYRMTNKNNKGANRAELIIIRGYPMTIFCSAGQILDEQEATRAILLSPEVSEEKIEEGITLQAIKGADLVSYQKRINDDEQRKKLMDRIIAIRDMEVDDVQIQHTDLIKQDFKAMVGTLKPRHMRDMGHLINLIKAIALLNVWHRQEGELVIASEQDVRCGIELWQYFVKSLQLGISPQLLDFYENFIVMAYYEKKALLQADDSFDMLEAAEPFGISRDELAKYHRTITSRPLNDEYLRKQILPQLENCGLIRLARPSTGDKRSRHIYPLLFLDD